MLTRICKTISSQRFIFWAVLAMLLVPNVLMVFTESTSLLTRLLSVALPGACYWLALGLSKKPGKVFWWLFWFIFIDAFQTVLLYLYGESPIAVDMFLNVATTNATESAELLGNILPAVVFVAVVYVSGIALSVVSMRSREQLPRPWLRRQRRMALGALAASVALTGVNLAIDKRFAVEDDIFPINGTYNLALAVARTHATVNYHKNSAQFSYQARSIAPSDSAAQVCVLVIGETSRADNWGIYGYSRPTTPRLSAMGSDSLVWFSDAVTMSNTTHKSVPLILTDVASQGDFGLVYRQKGVISAFAQAGYSTSWLSNQRRNHSLIDFLGSEAQHVDFIKDDLPLTANVNDDSLLVPLRRTLHKQLEAGKKKIFIVMHCYGSHFNYVDRYIGKQSVFTPDKATAVELANRSVLVNAYDNSIYYTDQLLASVINLLAQQQVPASLIYLSDHGEDILDDSRGRFLHASPLPTYWQVRVPFVAWASKQWRDAHPQQWQALQRNSRLPIATNRVTFHTLLEMNDIASPHLRHADAVSSPQFKPAQRLYVNDHDEFLPLDQAGFKPADAAQFRSHGLQFP